MRYDPAAISVLEPDQLSATRRPLSRRKFGKGTLALLILLRVYILIAVPIVSYTFVHALFAPQ